MIAILVKNDISPCQTRARYRRWVLETTNKPAKQQHHMHVIIVDGYSRISLHARYVARADVDLASHSYIPIDKSTVNRGGKGPT